MKEEGRLHLSLPEKKELRSLIKRRLAIRRARPNPKFTRFDYVRYADDWLIGVWGPYKYAKALKERIKIFLDTIKLELSEKKTLITSAITELAKFLGTGINTVSSRLGIRKTIRNKSGFQKRSILGRLPEGHVRMMAPISNILKRFEEKHFIKNKNGRLRPICPSQFTVLPVRDLIIRYRSILNGYLNYFSFADNRPMFRRVYWFLRESLLKAIGRKKQLNRSFK